MGKFGVVKMGQAPLVPPGVLSEALGFDGPADVLVIIRGADADDDQHQAVPVEAALINELSARQSHRTNL